MTTDAASDDPIGSGPDLPRTDCATAEDLPWGCACELDQDCGDLECNPLIRTCVPGCFRMDGCRCFDGCDAGLDCVDDFCIDRSCPAGSPGCACLFTGICSGGFACGDDEMC